MCNEIWSYGFCKIPLRKLVEPTHQGFLLMLCSVIPFVCVSQLYIYKIRSNTDRFSSRNFACLLENFIWREALAVMICNYEEAPHSECIPLLQVYSGDLLWAPMLNVLSSHKFTLYFCILAYIPSHKYPREYIPTCNPEPIWKCFQLHTVPISLLNIFNKMTKTNGRKHKLLNINKCSTRQSFSDCTACSTPVQ